MNKHEAALLEALGELSNCVTIFYQVNRHRGGHDYFAIESNTTHKVSTFELTDFAGVINFAKAVA